jgi:hypothetical protein
LVGGEAEPAFFGYLAVVDPDGEFAAGAFDEFGVDTEFFFDSGRRTEGPGSIGPSDRAEADSHFTHSSLVTFRGRKSQTTRLPEVASELAREQQRVGA